LDRQIEELAKLINKRKYTPVDSDFVDGFVNAAVMPIFPADNDHLNGTFQFCKSLGLDREKVLRSVADGCYQTLKGLAAARKGRNAASEHVHRSMKALCIKRKSSGEKIPLIQVQKNGQYLDYGDCPFFISDGHTFVCPFAKEETVKAYERTRKVYEMCANDLAHTSDKERSEIYQSEPVEEFPAAA
jgi:hypothetical protein